MTPLFLWHKMAEELSKSEVLHSVATGTALGDTFTVNGYDTVLFNVSNIGTATVSFEASDDNTNWFALNTTNVSDNTSGTTATATGLYRASITGLRYVRGRVSAFTAGTVTVNAIASTGEGASGGGGGGTGLTATQVQGAAADNAAAVGNPVLVGGEYNSSAPTYADGDAYNLQGDVNGLTKVREGYAPGAEDNTNGVIGNLQKPVASSTYSPSEATNFGAAAGTGILVKSSAGNVYAFDVSSTSTAVRYFQLFNQGTVAVVGQTPVASYPLGSVTAGGVSRLQVSSSDLAPSKHFTTGIAAAISSTNGTLGTASVTAAEHNWVIKYV